MNYQKVYEKEETKMRLQYKDVEINLTSEINKVVGNEFKLVSVRPYYEYKDGNKTDTVLGFNYEIVLLDRGYEKIVVKILGNDRLADNLSEEELQKGVSVGFSKLNYKVYGKASGDFISFNLTLTADNIFKADVKKI